MVQKEHFGSSVLSIDFFLFLAEKQGDLLEKKCHLCKKGDFGNRICQFYDFSTESVPD